MLKRHRTKILGSILLAVATVRNRPLAQWVGVAIGIAAFAWLRRRFGKRVERDLAEADALDSASGVR